MKRVINLDNWNRKEHFKFFSALDDPFWGITTTVDFTSIYQQSKNMEVSFFLYSVHFLLKCINATTAFKLRIENGEVVVDGRNVAEFIQNVKDGQNNTL